MSTTPDYNVSDLKAAVNAWIDTIYRNLIKPLPKLATALNAGLVGGRSLAAIRAELVAKVTSHSSVNNAHPLTLSDIYDHSSVKAPNLSNRVRVDWVTGEITVTSAIFEINGDLKNLRTVALPAAATGLWYVIVRLDQPDASAMLSRVPDILPMRYIISEIDFTLRTIKPKSLNFVVTE